jgi:WD40-like Beta Propeller Repeat
MLHRLVAVGAVTAAVVAFAVVLTGAETPAFAAGHPVLYLSSGSSLASGSSIDRFDLVTHTRSVVLPKAANRLYRGPVLSPDGRQLVVQRSYADTAGVDLVVVNVDGTRPHILSSVRFAGRVRTAWSPDSENITFSGSFGGQSYVFTASPYSIEHQTLEIGPGAHPSYSPDGSHIAFGDGSYVVVSDPYGNNPQQLAVGREPAWSPDGKHIAYTASNGVHVMAADGSGNRLVSPGSNPTWSPDGSRLLVTRETAPLKPGAPIECNTDIGDPDDVTECLGTVSAGGGDAAIIAGSMLMLLDTPDQAPLHAAWSRDGMTVYFSMQTSVGIATLPAAGGTIRYLTGGLDPVVGTAQPVYRVTVTLSADRSIVLYDRLTAFTGVVRTTSGAAVMGGDVTLQHRRLGRRTWTSVATRTTDSLGAYRFAVHLHVNAEYRVVFAEPFYVTSVSRMVTVRVRHLVYGGGPNDPWHVTVGHYTRFYGVVKPNHQGHTVYLQVRRDGQWRTVAGHVLGAPTATGVNPFAFRVRGNAPGTRTYRVLLKADALHEAGWVTCSLRVFSS